jgi:sugar O-acyltransferase (sialic acid O-acetyltransferase NeuD family)
VTGPNSHCGNVPDFQTLLVFGAGGSGREVAWLAEQAWGDRVRVRFVVDDPRYLVPFVNGRELMLLSDVTPDSTARFVVALGDSAARRRVAEAMAELGARATTIVHPRVEMSRWVDIGEGSIVCAGTVVTTNVQIGRHVQINVGCTISHDVVTGDFSTISPGVHIAGHVRIGHDVFIGTGASIINGRADAPLVIGDGAVVAAGACVVKPVEAGALVAGVPAVRKR